MTRRVLAARAAIACLLLAACAPAADPAAVTTPEFSVTTMPVTPAPAVTVQVLVREREGWSTEAISRVAGRDDIAAVRTLRSEQIGLRGTWDETGAQQLELPDRYMVPLDARALDAEEAAAVGLAPGTVVLTTTGAIHREVGTGGRMQLTFKGNDLDVVISAVRGDPRSGSSELLVHPDDADLLGFDPPSSLIVTLTQPRDLAAASETADAIERVLDDGFTRLLIDDGGERSQPLVLSLPATKARFGEFAFEDRAGTRDISMGVTWERANITRLVVPVLGNVRCHVAIMEDLTAVMEDLVAEGLDGEIDRSRYAGCYYPRRTSPNGSLSHHAWGIALDINVDFDVPGGGEVPHPGVIAAFARHGFRWGGEFPTPDNHHFEWAGLVDPPG